MVLSRPILTALVAQLLTLLGYLRTYNGGKHAALRLQPKHGPDGPVQDVEGGSEALLQNPISAKPRTLQTRNPNSYTQTLNPKP